MVASPWKWQLPIRETCATPSTGWPKTFGSEVGTRANVFPVVTRMAAALAGGPSFAPAGERLMARAAHVRVRTRGRNKLRFFIGFLSFWVCFSFLVLVRAICHRFVMTKPFLVQLATNRDGRGCAWKHFRATTSWHCFSFRIHRSSSYSRDEQARF